MLRLLYHEAKSNLLNGRYPVDEQEYYTRGTLSAVITYKELQASNNPSETVESDFGSPAYFKYVCFSILVLA